MTIATGARLFTVTGRFYWNEASQQWLPNPEKPPSACEARVCAEINPDRQGFSNWFSVAALAEKLPTCRSLGGVNGSGMFTRELAKDFNFAPDQAKEKDGSRIVRRRAYGLTKNRAEQFPIRSDIRREISKGFCAALGTRSQLEVDHKDGRKDNWQTNSVELQRLEDFQALHKTANGVKREQCKHCERSNRRFDARHLGFQRGWTEGGAEYQGTCRGCFWFDPVAFRQALQ